MTRMSCGVELVISGVTAGQRTGMPVANKAGEEKDLEHVSLRDHAACLAPPITPAESKIELINT